MTIPFLFGFVGHNRSILKLIPLNDAVNAKSVTLPLKSFNINCVCV